MKKRVDAWKATMARAAAAAPGATEPAHRTRTTVATESEAQGAMGEPSPEAPASGAQGTERPLAERIEAAKYADVECWWFGVWVGVGMDERVCVLGMHTVHLRLCVDMV